MGGLITIAVIGALGFGGYYVYSNGYLAGIGLGGGGDQSQQGQGQGPPKRRQDPQKRDTPVKPDQKEGDPKPDSEQPIYNDKGEDTGSKKKWSLFSNAERVLYRKHHSSGSGAFVWILVIVLLLAAVGAGVYFFMFNKSDEDDELV